MQSEALTWDAGKRNQLITRTLSNNCTYHYVIDDEGIVHIYSKEKATNIHEMGEDYGNTDTTQLDMVTKKLRTGQGRNSGNSNLVQNGRNPRAVDTEYNNSLRREGRDTRARHSKTTVDAYRKPKIISRHFNDDVCTGIYLHLTAKNKKLFSILY